MRVHPFALLSDETTSIPAILRPPLPLITSRQLAFPPKFKTPRQTWVSNMDTVEEEKLGLIDLHPDVFAEKPRVDLMHANVRWQRMYRHVVCIIILNFLIPNLFNILSVIPVICSYQSAIRSERRW